MREYDSLDDQVTVYFVMLKDPQHDKKIIKAYTDNKDLVKFYLEFHNCKYYSLHKLEDTYGKIVPILNENHQQEIGISYIYTRDPKRKNKDKPMKLIPVPLTTLEVDWLEELHSTSCGAMVNYHFIHDSLWPILKDKYQKALSVIGLKDAIVKEIYNNKNVFSRIWYDDVALLSKFFQDEFT